MVLEIALGIVLAFVILPFLDWIVVAGISLFLVGVAAVLAVVVFGFLTGLSLEDWRQLAIFGSLPAGAVILLLARKVYQRYRTDQAAAAALAGPNRAPVGSVLPQVDVPIGHITIGKFARHVLVTHPELSNEQVLALVKHRFKEVRTNIGCIAWYRRDLEMTKPCEPVAPEPPKIDRPIEPGPAQNQFAVRRFAEYVMDTQPELSDQEVLTLIKQEFKDAKTVIDGIAYYRSELRKLGDGPLVQ
jgi:hypothetical protein